MCNETDTSAKTLTIEQLLTQSQLNTVHVDIVRTILEGERLGIPFPILVWFEDPDSDGSISVDDINHVLMTLGAKDLKPVRLKWGDVLTSKGNISNNISDRYMISRHLKIDLLKCILYIHATLESAIINYDDEVDTFVFEGVVRSGLKLSDKLDKGSVRIYNYLDPHSILDHAIRTSFAGANGLFPKKDKIYRDKGSLLYAVKTLKEIDSIEFDTFILPENFTWHHLTQLNYPIPSLIYGMILTLRELGLNIPCPSDGDELNYLESVAIITSFRQWMISGDNYPTNRVQYSIPPVS